MTYQYEDAIELLGDYNIKPSFQRVKVLEFLMNNKIHPTADDVFKGIIKEVPTLSKATVYNTLNLFVEKKLLSTMSADYNETRFDLLIENHGHFVCESCGEIFDFPYSYKDNYESLEGFHIQKEEIVLKGLCNKCLNK